MTSVMQGLVFIVILNSVLNNILNIMVLDYILVIVQITQ